MGKHTSRWLTEQGLRKEAQAQANGSRQVPPTGKHKAVTLPLAPQDQTSGMLPLHPPIPPTQRHRGWVTQETIKRDKVALANPFGPSPYGAHRGISTFANQDREKLELSRIYLLASWQ